MMKEWLVTHVDAVIPIVIGAYLCLKALFKRESPTWEDAKKRKNLPLWGAVLIAIGIFRMFTGSLATTPASPVTATTDDGMVSAEFPKAPVRTEAVDEAQGIRVHRVTRACNFQGIDLRLSYNEFPPGGKETPAETLLANMKEYFKQQGFELVGSSELAGSIHELVMNKPDVEVRQVMRIWFGPEGVYRVLATTEKGHHEDPHALSFISSFRRTKAGLGE
jgi:hypothetical protein